MEEYTIDNPNVVILDNSPEPLDKTVIIEYTENGVFLSVFSDPEADLFIASSRSITDYFEDSRNFDKYIIESYVNEPGTNDSPYYQGFLQLQSKILKKWDEIKEHEIDTKYYGVRIGASVNSNGLNIFAEAFNLNQPEHKEYIQIRKQNSKTIYTVSHESYFMKYQLGDIYKFYFDEPPEEKYIVNISDINDLDRKYYYFAESFRNLQRMITEQEFLNDAAEIKEEYASVVTSIRGINKDEHQIIEMTLDKNKASRIYLSIQLLSDISTKYRITKNSVLEAILTEEPLGDCLEEHDDINLFKECEKAYFVDLKKSFDYMIKNRHNYLWRYGDGNKYNI